MRPPDRIQSSKSLISLALFFRKRLSSPRVRCGFFGSRAGGFYGHVLLSALGAQLPVDIQRVVDLEDSAEKRELMDCQPYCRVLARPHVFLIAGIDRSYQRPRHATQVTALA